MARSDDTRIARAVSVRGCPNPACACGSLILQMHDETGNVLLGAVLPKPVADVFAARVAALTGSTTVPDLSVIRCQGFA